MLDLRSCTSSAPRLRLCTSLIPSSRVRPLLESGIPAGPNLIMGSLSHPIARSYKMGATLGTVVSRLKRPRKGPVWVVRGHFSTIRPYIGRIIQYGAGRSDILSTIYNSQIASTYGSRVEPGRCNQCQRCGYSWMPRDPSHLPAKCPSCRSTRWHDYDARICRCSHCGREWMARVGRPVKCPSCQSLRWDVAPSHLACRRCGHEWVTRMGRTPADVRICPRCKTEKWNVPKNPSGSDTDPHAEGR